MNTPIPADPSLTPELTEVILAWQRTAAQAKQFVATERDLRAKVVAGAFTAPAIGINHFGLGGGYDLAFTRKLNYSLNDKEADGYPTNKVVEAIENLGPEGKFLAERLVKWSPELSVSEYKKLDPNNPLHVQIKAMIDTVLTIKDAAPELVLIPPKTAG